MIKLVSSVCGIFFKMDKPPKIHIEMVINSHISKHVISNSVPKYNQKFVIRDHQHVKDFTTSDDLVKLCYQKHKSN